MKSFRKGEEDEEDEEDEGRYISCVKGKRYEKKYELRINKKKWSYFALVRWQCWQCFRSSAC